MKIVLFDADCLVCNRFINFINKNDTNNEIYFCNLNGKYAANLLENHQYNGHVNSIIFVNDVKFYTKFDAIRAILIALNGWFKIFNLLKLIPLSLGNIFYDRFASNRLLFGSNKNICNYNPKLIKQILG